MANKQNNSQVLKGLLDALVLEVLSSKDSYGFEIYQTITERMQEDAGLFRESTLYPLLHRMEKKGLVAPYWKPGDRGTDRKYYKITKTGEEQLNERVENWLKVVRVLERTILKPKEQ
ncbi:MAG: PadR family transcriptional regulator [Planctomycetaceae bacterium]|nr:PadR family transcriptional regulator [Planctomycetaceae bacterium]